MPYEDREWLRVRYDDRKMTLRDIAREGGCGLRTIARWMETHGITTRKGDEQWVKDRSGPNNYRWRGATICPQCGGKKSAQSFSCPPCYYKRNSGPANYNYRGLANVMNNLRGRIAAEWRPRVFDRDRFTCQGCGDNTGGNLHAHHKIPLSSLVRTIHQARKPDLSTPENRLNFIETLWADPAIRSIDNGITLCKPCHTAAHKLIKLHHSMPRKRRVLIRVAKSLPIQDQAD